MRCSWHPSNCFAETVDLLTFLQGIIYNFITLHGTNFLVATILFKFLISCNSLELNTKHTQCVILISASVFVLLTSQLASSSTVTFER